ncbi:nadph-dependent fmn reductase [Lucifera butyrica]|uniref:Nadph-dependent fmn reductase n=1 Tax=Lucifera butyrica TaxID=1351585 RepID=A0A498R8N0_9FIRM|nr:flavodoxin family protein [Lucifera butyrica]VBB07549.1 nadph-dependent fmn reductase [Lucifera butyrica]
MNRSIKIVGVISSSHHNGNSATLAREALKGAAEEGAQVTEIYLPKQRVEFCTGCLKCLEGKCPFSDDFETLRKLVYEADGIIFSSPTFATAPNAIMKNFIDRLGMYERFTSSLGGKYIVGIATAGHTGAKKVAMGLTCLARDGIFKRGYVSGILGINIGSDRVVNDAGKLMLARNLGKKITRDIKTYNKYPFQNLIGRWINCLFVRPHFYKVILKNKDGSMKAVYNNLSQRGLIQLDVLWRS